MLEILKHIETHHLAKLLENTSGWNSLFIDYETPIVERVWRQWQEFRICLHQIHPCLPHQGFFHSHTWPSAMRIISGSYHMRIGFGKNGNPPTQTTQLILAPGSAYEMIHPDQWHFVAPVSTTLTLMVTAKPWTKSEKPHKPLGPLSKKQQEEIFAGVREYYTSLGKE